MDDLQTVLRLVWSIWLLVLGVAHNWGIYFDFPVFVHYVNSHSFFYMWLYVIFIILFWCFLSPTDLGAFGRHPGTLHAEGRPTDGEWINHNYSEHHDKTMLLLSPSSTTFMHPILTQNSNAELENHITIRSQILRAIDAVLRARNVIDLRGMAPQSSAKPENRN